MNKAKQSLWTNGVEGAIVEHRPIDPGEDDARHDCPTVARGHGPPDGGHQREVPLGCADGCAPLSALPGLGRTKRAPCRGARRALARAHRLARRRVQAPGPGPVDRVASRAAVSPLASRYAHLIANNARFLIVPGCAVANLASRVLALSVRRLSGDFRAVHGHPILLAEA